MDSNNETASDFLIYCSIGFFVVCVLVAYLLYWFIRKSKSERFSKIRFRSRKSKSLGKTGRGRSKIADEQKARSGKKAPKTDEEAAFIKVERRVKDESSTSSSKSLRQVELQEELQQAKVSAEQPSDYGSEVRTIIKHQQQTSTYTGPPEYTIEVMPPSLPPPPPPPPPQKMPQIRLPSEAKKEKSIVLVEPNKFLKEAGIAQEQEPVKERLKTFGSRVDGARSNLMAKKMDSVVAYQTSPISLEGQLEPDITPSVLNGSKYGSKMADDNKNATSILSVANSQVPRETSESFLSKSCYNMSTVNKSNMGNEAQRSSNVTFTSKEVAFPRTTSSSSSGRTSQREPRDDMPSRRHESKRKHAN